METLASNTPMKRITLSLFAFALLGTPALTSCSKKDSPAEVVKPSSRISIIARALSGSFHGEQMASPSTFTKSIIECEDLVFTPYPSPVEKFYQIGAETFQAFGTVTSENYLKIDGVAKPSIIKYDNIYGLHEEDGKVYLSIYRLDVIMKDILAEKKARVITDVTYDGFKLLRFEGATSASDKMAFTRR